MLIIFIFRQMKLFWKLVSVVSFLFCVNSSYIKGNSIYVGTWAFCSNTCTEEKNNDCTGKCITFRDNTGGKNIRNQQFLAE